MQKERLKYLLEKYSDGELSGLESVELFNWFDQLDYSTKDLDQWITESGGEEIVANQLYEDFERKMRRSTKTKHLLITKIIAVAAMVTLLVSAGFYFYKSYLLNNGKIELNKMEIAAIKPGGNKAVLTLSNGKQIDLETVAYGQLSEAGAVQIKKTAEGQVAYNTTSNKTSVVETNSISTPNGGQYQVILADGTHVWLNASSSLRYPTAFNGDERKVELSGEAYFEVTHNKRKPFIVATNNQMVKVLGTHFNIDAYPDELSAKTTLLEGSVLVSANSSKESKILSPGQQAVFTNNNISVQDVKIKGVMAWKNGYFMFQDEDVYSIMKKVSRWYDVDIVYKDDFNNKRFGGYVSRSKKLKDLLDVLETTDGIHFKIEGRTVFVLK